jgi:hypothetical protein
MYPGKWGRMIQKQYREEELLQFLGRLRPVYREGMAPIWFSLSSVIPEEVIVDDLITIEDLLKRGRAETSTYEVMRRCHGVLDADLAYKLCDDLYSSERGAASHMVRDGYNPMTGEINVRAAWGVSAFRWLDEDGEEGYSFVRSDIANPEQALRNAFSRHLGRKVRNVSKISEALPPTMARGRKSDKIEDELGTLDARRADEQKHAEDVAEFILMNTPAEAMEVLKEERKERMLPVMLPSGVRKDEKSDKPEEYKVNFSEIESRLAIENLWRKLGWTQTKISTMMADVGLKEAEAENAAVEAQADYSAAGDHLNDASQEWGEVDDWIIPF